VISFLIFLFRVIQRIFEKKTGRDPEKHGKRKCFFGVPQAAACLGRNNNFLPDKEIENYCFVEELVGGTALQPPFIKSW